MDCSLPVHAWDSPGKNTGVSCLPPGYLPNPEIEPLSPILQADSLLLSYWESSPRVQRGHFEILQIMEALIYFWSCAH